METKEFKIKNISPVKWFWEQTEFSFLTTPRTSYGFLSVERGKVDFIIGDKIISLKKGDFIYLPKNSIYKARFHINEGEVETFLVNFDLDEGEDLPIAPFYNSYDESLQLETALKRLCDLQFEENSEYLKQAYFYLCFHVIFNNYIHNRHSVDTELIAKAKNLLKKDELSVEEIAEELKISASGFRKKFKDAVGLSPAQWRTENRIERAKQLLITGDLSIDAIAEQTGFYDTPYFYKKFYSIVGMTPKKYRETEIMF